MNIITGFLKGRKIPFPLKNFPEAQTTPAKVKEALFSILGEDLREKCFLDLFTCSGQIGLEAISRGAKFVLFNDIDASCTRVIGDTLRAWEIAERGMVLHMPARQCLRYCQKHELAFDIAFLDPPYEKIRGRSIFLNDLLEIVGSYDIFNNDATIILQHYYANELPEKAQKFHLTKTKRYGTSGLAIYHTSVQTSL